MQVTLEALSTQVTRLEGVCDIYILEDNPYLDEHPDAYRRICGTLVCDFVSCFKSAYCFITGFDNMSVSSVSLDDMFKTLRKQQDINNMIRDKCHTMHKKSEIESVGAMFNELHILRDIRNLPVHEGKWEDIHRVLTFDTQEVLHYLVALIGSCIDEEMDYERYFDLAQNVYSAMEALVYKE